MKYTYDYLISRLVLEELEVTFEKVDGTMRTMRCTLLPQYLPEEFRNKAPMLTETTPLTISVWDLDNSGWRSFRVDNVRNVV